MLTPDTFLLTLYVRVDDFCKARLPPVIRPGPAASLDRSEILTPAIFAPWGQFPSERAFYRYAVRHHTSEIMAFFLHVVDLLEVGHAPQEALDGTAVVIRNAKRRGEGWLCGQADIGYSNRLGWYEGFYVLGSVTPEGVLTGFGFTLASTKDQRVDETFFAARATAAPELPSVGRTHPDRYVCDNHCLHDFLRLDSERPHALDAVQARLAATCALHNVCVWLNRQLGRPNLAFAELIDW